jgi:uncharacterized repeat protein (TIGR02543 family)
MMKKVYGFIAAAALVLGAGFYACDTDNLAEAIGGGTKGTGDITYSVQADGVPNTVGSTAISFTFSGAVAGLTAAEILVVNDTGAATKGALTGSGTGWWLGIDVTTAGNVKVVINKAGIESTVKDVTVHKAAGTQYTVTFDSSGGSPVAAFTAGAGTQVMQPEDPDRDGYVFTGWFSAAEGGSLYVWPFALGADVTVYAHWRNGSDPAPVQLTITFDSNGGSGVAAVTADEGTSVLKPADPVKDGYAFSGWFSAAEGGSLYEWPHALDADVTLFAQWTARYTVTFDSNGGSEVAAVTADAGSSVSKPGDPEKEGFVFDGWFSDTDGGTAYTWPHTLNADVTLYAHWRDGNDPAPEQYTITFDSNGGSEVAAVTADLWASVPKPVDPEKEGFVFAGWFSAAEGGMAYTWPHNLYMDITVYAQWTPSGKLPVAGGFNYGGIPVLKDGGAIEGSFEIKASVTLSVAADAGYSNITWYVAGQSGPAATANTYTLDPAQFGAKKNAVTVTGVSVKDGKLYSRVVEFVITE